MIKVHHMVLDKKGHRHQISDNLCIFGQLKRIGIFYTGNRCTKVRVGTDTANPAGKQSCISRVAALEDDLYPAKELPAGISLLDNTLFVNLDFDPEMPLYSRDGVNHNFFMLHLLTSSRWQTYRQNLPLRTPYSRVPPVQASLFLH